MEAEIIQNHKGRKGVFIPLEDWEEMKAVYPEIQNIGSLYQLSDKQKDILDSQDDLADSEYQDNDEFIKELKVEYGL